MTPEGWSHTKLGKLAATVTSGSRDWAQYYSDSGAKFIRMTNLRRDGIDLKLDDLKYVNVKSESADGRRTQLEHGDILISITAELGKIGWIPKNFGEAYINQHTALVRLNKLSTDSKFVAYLLSSRKMNYTINRLNDAGAKAGLNLQTIKSIPIELPPPTEQIKISDILSTWDKAIVTVEKLIENSSEQKKSLMQKLLTGKKRFSEFNSKWKESKLEELMSEKKRKGKIVETNDKGQGQPYIGSTSFQGDFSQYTESYDTTPCNTDDILILWDGEYAGKTATGLRGAVSSTVVRIRLNKKLANNIFVHNRLLYDNYKLRAIREGSGIPHMPGDFEHWYKINTPELEEQKKIAATLSVCDEEIKILNQKLEHLKLEKKALMQQLLTGKRRVSLEKGVD